MLTVKEVSERLRVSRECVYALVNRGLLSCIRIGIGRGTIRFTETDLQEFISRSRVNRPGTHLKHIRSRS